MIYTTNLDWLQLYCHGDKIVCDEAKGDTFKFRVRNTGKETMQFLTLLYIYIEKVKVAEILQVPRSNIINSKATIVKIENQLLYTSQYMQVAYEILKAFNLCYKGITRIDLALDCQTLKEGKDVQEFLRQTIMLNEQEKGYIYNVGRAHSTYHLQLDGKTGNRIVGVKWGSPHSAVSCYVYDKTLELIEQKDKPWIRDAWQQAGLDYLYNDDELNALSDKQKQRLVKRTGLSCFVKKPVWRFEISIKADGKDLLCLETGELFTLGMDDIQNSILIRNLFFSYAKQCFNFRMNTGQELRRNFKPIEIFEYNQDVQLKPKYWRYLKETGRSEKVCYNKLSKLKELIPEEDDELNYHFRKTMEFISRMSAVKHWLYMQKKNFECAKESRTYKQMFSDYWNQYLYYSAGTKEAKNDPPSQAELDRYIDSLMLEQPDWMEADESLWLSIEEEMHNMQSPTIVIPEGAKRLSPDIARAREC